MAKIRGYLFDRKDILADGRLFIASIEIDLLPNTPRMHLVTAIGQFEVGGV